MAQHGKKYTNALAQVDREALYSVSEAVVLIKELASAKFDETVELAVRLGVDPRKADQIVRGTLSLPEGTGKTNRVAVFAAGDAAIATPDLMGQVGSLGRVLGPRGLMPNPKTGTVTTDVGRTVAEFKGGRVEYRTDRVGNVHVRIGKVSFTREQLLENFRAVIDELSRVKPASAKGRYL